MFSEDNALLKMRELFSDPPRLETDRLILRPLRMRDAVDLYAYSSDPEVSRYVLWNAHTSIRDSRKQLRAAIHQYHLGEPCSWGICDKTTGHLIGTIGFMWLSYDSLSAEIGYSLSRSYWNRGLMTEALQSMISFSFEQLHLNRLEAQHVPQNPASGRVMQKCGMAREGLLRSRVRLKGVLTDTVLYSILLQDYRRNRTKNGGNHHDAL